MTLVVSVGSGTPAAKEYKFEDGRSEPVRFGRSLNASVSWPVEDTLIGHDHFDMRYEAGVWKFSINTKHRVFIEGRDVPPDMELVDPVTVNLGTPNGPTVSLKVMRVSNYRDTDPQGSTPTDRALVERARANIFAVVGAVGVLAATSGYFIHSLFGDVARIENSLVAIAGVHEQSKKEIKDVLATVSDKTDFSDVFDRSDDATFLVDIVMPDGTSAGGATAWVVKLADGTKAFATNGHVAAAFDQHVKNGAAGARMVVRSPEPGHREYNISSQISHPAYDEFMKRAAEIDKEVSQGLSRDLGAMPGYDVALLVPETQADLPDALPLASPQEISELRAGSPLGMLGYPMEQVHTINRLQPKPEAQKGIVTSITSFFLTPTPNQDSQLIQHNLPATGGASGSPIFNSAGHVVALLNAGNITTSHTGARTPSAVLINFAQRVDLLRELIDGSAQNRMVEYRKTWTESAERAHRKIDAIVAEQVKVFQSDYSGAEESGSANGTIATPDVGYGGHLTASFNFNFVSGYTYLLIAWSPDRVKLSAFLVDDASSDFIDSNVADAPIVKMELATAKSTKARLAIVSAAVDEQGKPSAIPVKFNVLVWRAKN